MALIPALVMAVVAEGGVFALGLPVWGEYYGPAPREALDVEVVGRQFFWIIRYPGPDQQFGATASGLVTTENTLGLDKRDPAGQDDIVLLNELHLPANRPVRLQIRSLDVILSFFLPELRVKQDAMPGMRVSVWFVPTQAGDFEGPLPIVHRGPYEYGPAEDEHRPQSEPATGSLEPEPRPAAV